MGDLLINDKCLNLTGAKTTTRTRSNGVTPSSLKLANFSLISLMERVPLMAQFLYFVSVQSAVERVIDQRLHYLHLTGGRGSSQLLIRITIIDCRLSHHHPVNTFQQFFLNLFFKSQTPFSSPVALGIVEPSCCRCQHGPGRDAHLVHLLVWIKCPVYI